jgi:hypothetical protein
MAKKLIDEDDDFENDFENEEQDNFVEEEPEENEDDDSEGGVGRLSDDDDGDLDIVIEIDEDELDLTKDDNIIQETTEEDDSIVLSKHKIEGKHSLKYDSIFKGKKEDPVDDEESLDGFSGYYKDTIEVDKSSAYHTESIDNETYIRAKLVKERVYEILKEHTTINFLNNRRKPSRNDFNTYYTILKSNLKTESFTNIELFNELAVYFSDNLFNMFKLLDNNWRNLIINELQDHIGKNANSKEITNRNIYVGTELEFMWEDEFGEDMIITGVVLECDYDNSMFKIDSYENIYELEINQITKILNNTKFKYNLNKLNNIDFL